MKEDPSVEIGSHEYFTAQNNWVTFWGEQKILIPSFSNYLGMTNDPMHKVQLVKGHNGKRKYIIRYHAYISVRASAARKIKALSGPNWFALLKAYQIRKAK